MANQLFQDFLQQRAEACSQPSRTYSGLIGGAERGMEEASLQCASHGQSQPLSFASTPGSHLCDCLRDSGTLGWGLQAAWRNVGILEWRGPRSPK